MPSDRRNHFRPIVAAAIAASTLAMAFSVSALAGPKAVLELFTSQGCSSCPPADKLLGGYAQRHDVIALSFSVDIWDYLGWKDTLASHENTERQRAYAQMRGDRQIYTPQMVINGDRHVVGSDGAAIDAAVGDAARQGGLPVPIDISLADEAVNIEVGAMDLAMPNRGTLWLVLFDDVRSVPIARGENSGRTITYRHVVRKMQRIGMWKGQAMSISLPETEMYESGADGCAVLLQTETANGQPGTMLGAALVDRRGA